MESEANVPQEPVSPEVAANTETPVAQEVVGDFSSQEAPEPAASASTTDSEAATETMEASAAEADENATETAIAPDVPASAPQEQQVQTEQTEDNTIVATADVAPARSKIDIARIAKESLIEQAKALVDSTDWRKTTDSYVWYLKEQGYELKVIE